MKAQLTEAMTALARDPKMRFVGYGMKRNGAGGTLAGVPQEQIIETTVAEGMMTGLAIGLSLKGYKPLVYFERFDFILNAADAIVNHLDKLQRISDGEFKPACIFRVVVGNRLKPRFTGPTHTQDFTDAMQDLVSFPVIRLGANDNVANTYAAAKESLDAGHSTMIVELKDLL